MSIRFGIPKRTSVTVKVYGAEGHFLYFWRCGLCF